MLDSDAPFSDLGFNNTVICHEPDKKNAVESAGLSQETGEVLALIEEQGYSGNVITFNIAIKKLAEQGDWRGRAGTAEGARRKPDHRVEHV